MSSSDLNEVRAAVAKVINFIVKRSALTHRQFQSLLEEMDSAYSNLALHSAREVAKLRKGFRAVCRLLRCIKAFLSTAGGRAVGGETHVSDGHNRLNELHLRLQGAGPTVLDMCDTWTAFVSSIFK